MSVLSNHWIQKRAPYWERLTTLVASANGSRLSGLSRAELQEMALLYRQAASDLSTLRQDRTSAALAGQMNHLLARAHHIIYSSRKTSWRSFFLFLRDGYPLVLRQQIAFLFASLFLTLLGALVAVALGLANPHFLTGFLGPRMMHSIAQHKMWTDSIVSVAPQTASGILTHNITVTLLTFAGGVVFGLGSVYLLFFNGMMLGAVGLACRQGAMSIPLWSFVAPHGSLELPAIFIAGAAGLRLGHGMLFPGIYTWKDSVANAGADAVRLISGTIPMLVIAGCLEGFFSPTSAPVALKFSVGGVLFTLLLLWLFRPLAKPSAGLSKTP